jgi:hypothetical protein
MYTVYGIYLADAMFIILFFKTFNISINHSDSAVVTMQLSLSGHEE